MSRHDFNILLKFLSNYGIESAKLVKTTSDCVLNVHELFKKRNISTYSCIDASPFITALFIQDFHVRTDIQFEQLEEHKKYDKLMKKSFTDMHLTWFHITDILGAHECNLIYISSDEIYFIDYYMETGRQKLFRIIKFNSESEAKKMIQQALFNGNDKMYDLLFDFQYQVQEEGEPREVSTKCHIFKIDQLPTFTRLQELWEQSRTILIKDFENEILGFQEGKKPSNKFWNQFGNEMEYDFEAEYDQKVNELTLFYEQVETINTYYTVI